MQTKSSPEGLGKCFKGFDMLTKDLQSTSHLFSTFSSIKFSLIFSGMINNKDPSFLFSCWSWDLNMILFLWCLKVFVYMIVSSGTHHFYLSSVQVVHSISIFFLAHSVFRYYAGETFTGIQCFRISKYRKELEVQGHFVERMISRALM